MTRCCHHWLAPSHASASRLSHVAPLQDEARRRQRIAEHVEDAALQAFRRHHRGRIDARPALAVEPDLGPRVRIGLAHDQVFADRVPLAAEISRDDARRNARRAHHRRVRGSEVRAETHASMSNSVVSTESRLVVPGSSVYSRPWASEPLRAPRAHIRRHCAARARISTRQRARARIAVGDEPRFVAAAERRERRRRAVRR